MSRDHRVIDPDVDGAGSAGNIVGGGKHCDRVRHVGRRDHHRSAHPLDLILDRSQCLSITGNEPDPGPCPREAMRHRAAPPADAPATTMV